ncbi:chemotaxis protein CheW [Phenylobacterium immobile]|uniref:chemotaxis protein CheW n=1 Tax=Phenylobacterium immobile TaxID=21 RepID=UPI000A7FD985|nr:chemotaxis protein CheW [Phenylobacterium immobile]
MGPTPLGFRVLSERTRRLAGRSDLVPEADQTPTAVLMICVVAGGLYGLPLEAVTRARPYRRAGAAPGARGGVIGLAVEDGRIRPVADLAARLGLAEAAPTDGGYLLTLAHHDLALRTMTLPEAGQVELLDTADGPRGRVLDGAHASKIIVRLNVDDLVAAHA